MIGHSARRALSTGTARKRVAVILSGSGVYDGSEITEAVSVLIHLSRNNIEYRSFAPDAPQLHVVNHITGDAVPDESRNTMEESARIARGEVRALSGLQVGDFDGLVVPGGFGAAKNLSTFATDGVNMTVLEDMQRVVLKFREQRKPQAYCCIAPVIVAKCLGARVTIGDDLDTMDMVDKIGGHHVKQREHCTVVDEKNNVLSTPAYMHGHSMPHEVFDGIGDMIAKLAERL